MKRIQFKDSATNEVRVTNGDYSREFKRADQPFEVEADEGRMLKQTGLFEEAPMRQLPASSEEGESQEQ